VEYLFLCHTFSFLSNFLFFSFFPPRISPPAGPLFFPLDRSNSFNAPLPFSPDAAVTVLLFFTWQGKNFVCFFPALRGPALGNQEHGIRPDFFLSFPVV